MSQIGKGKISSFSSLVDANGDATAARIVLVGGADMVTREYTIPWYLRGDLGGLAAGVDVVFASFDDRTGIILARMDGEPGSRSVTEINL